MNRKNGLSADEIQIEFTFARFSEIKGKFERALAGYRKILSFRPDHEPSVRALGNLLLKLKSFKEAAELYEEALKISPGNEIFQKNFVTSLVEENGLDFPFAYFGLSRIDSNELSVEPADVLACVVVRNEAARLPFFLEYYREKGVDKFFFVDNLSSDPTADYLRRQADVFLWQTAFSFKQANFGSVWFEVLLRKYGVGHWVLTVDADEILYYPNVENKIIPELCAELDAEKKRAYPAILLDMYSDKSLGETRYVAGQNFFEVCPFFDRKFYHRRFEEAGAYENQTFYFGGMRERIFGAKGDYLLSKIPLLKYDADVILAGGQHFTNLSAAEISEESGCLLHFKYFDFFADYVRKEVERNQHACDSMQYRQYRQTLENSAEPVFYDALHSVRLRDSRQLVELGAMLLDEEPEVLQTEFPRISPVASGIERPFWSIKITAYRRVKFLKQALASVLEATKDCENAEIEVINDGAEADVQAQIKAIVERTGRGRIKFHHTERNLGHPHIFNLCLDRASGNWIHLLHDDDLVRPDFYKNLEAGIKSEPHAGAAFCRFAYINEDGTERSVSNLERQTAGIIENWLERIAEHCLVQFPAIIVKRAVYEKIGGFCPEAGSAFDWEMWKRIAVSFPVWYEPQTSAAFREHADALSHRLVGSGQQIADSRKTIAISNGYLPAGQKKFLSKRASRALGLFAVEQARRQIDAGDKQGAQANLREALLGSRVSAVVKAAEKLAKKHDLDFNFGKRDFAARI